MFGVSLRRKSLAATQTQVKRGFSSLSSTVGGRRRFYEKVGVDECAAPWNEDEEDRAAFLQPRGWQSASASTGNKGWYGVTLDGRWIRTPSGRSPLSVPSPTLASAIAVEWDTVASTDTINPTQMPMTTLACTALDQLAAVSPQDTVDGRQLAVQRCISFLLNDTTCYFADPTHDPALRTRQDRAWTDLHRWIQTTMLKSPPALSLPKHSDATSNLLVTGRSFLMGNLPHPTPLLDAAQTYLKSLDAWDLTACQCIAAESKSLLLALAVLEGYYDTHESKTMHDAILAARVEEEHQIQAWGMVEGGHDYDRLNATVQLSSAYLMCRMVRHKHHIS